jgi:hypothetical protein
MGIPRSAIVAGCVLVLTGLSRAQAGPEKGADSATRAYLLIREKICAAPVTAATLLPHLSASRRRDIEAAPDFAKAWINCKAKVKVAGEKPPDRDGIVELKLAGTERDVAIQGGAWLVREEGSWKLDNQVIVPK